MRLCSVPVESDKLASGTEVAEYVAYYGNQPLDRPNRVKNSQDGPHSCPL